MPKVQVSKLHAFAGHRDCVYSLEAVNGSPIFFSAGGDGMLVKWDLEQPDEGQLVAQLPNSVYAIHLLPELNLLVAGHNYEGVHLIDWQERKEIGSLKLTSAPIFDIQSNKNELYVATGDGIVFHLDAVTLAVKNRVMLSDKSARTLSVCAARGELAVGYSDNRVRILDLVDLSEKYSWAAHVNSVFDVRYSPDEELLFTVSRDARLKGWHVKTGYTPAFEVLAHMYAINSIDFSPDGKHFVTCSMDKSIKVWDASELKLLKVVDKARHAGHGTSVNRVLWMDFRDRLISAGDDRMIAAWDVNFLN